MQSNLRTAFLAALSVLMLAACGGGGGGDGTPAPGAVTITSQPTDQSVVVGTAATFTVVASNATGYEWQRSTDGGANFSDMPSTNASTTTDTLTLTAVPLADNSHQFRVVVSNGVGSAISNSALLTVNPPAPTTGTWNTSAWGSALWGP
jgi:hypothetical protein